MQRNSNAMAISIQAQAPNLASDLAILWAIRES
jgi:hypothetical protein